MINSNRNLISFLIFSYSALLKNHTLKFLSKALPILKADDSLPKVATVQSYFQNSLVII